jgi:hypothetical protein
LSKFYSSSILSQSSDTDQLLIGSDLLHAHLRRHEKRLQRNGEGRSTMSPDATSPSRVQRTLGPRKNSQYEQHSNSVRSDALRHEWPPMNDATTSGDVYMDSEVDSSGSIQRPQTNDSLPQANLSALEEPSMTNTVGQFAPVEIGVGPNQNEFSWLFQEPGIFGLPGDNYFSLPGEEYFNMPLNVSVDLSPGALDSIQFVREWYF